MAVVTITGEEYLELKETIKKLESNTSEWKDKADDLEEVSIKAKRLEFENYDLKARVEQYSKDLKELREVSKIYKGAYGRFRDITNYGRFSFLNIFGIRNKMKEVVIFVETEMFIRDAYKNFKKKEPKVERGDHKQF